MIAVIADDFTGAAEIGGIGLRYGWNVVIETGTVNQYHADLLVIATDTRSLKGGEAVEIITDISKQLMKHNPEFIYKKVDSVLRGNVLDELFAQMKTTGKKRSIVIAANPVFNRMIRDGVYYIDDIPLQETGFSDDPEHSVHSSSVADIVGRGPVFGALNPKDELPEKGLILGDVTSIKDLENWAGRIDEKTLPAGASGFFNTLLEKRKIKHAGGPQDTIPFGQNALFILGSTFPNQYSMEQKIMESGHYLSNMPAAIYSNPVVDSHVMEDWAEDIAAGIRGHKKAVVAILHHLGYEPGHAYKIRLCIGALVRKVFEKMDINELIIEGGATAWEVLKALQIKELFPFQELETGIIRMRTKVIPGLYITTKPGSYLWPDELWFLKGPQPMHPLTKKEKVK